ncbi:hypothetical protein Q8F55_007295 [Vanrija albida]|uniref:Cytochrome P450 n=1 Tax=Vanrija albida TaxID=181172 RepID=A0ABR3PZD0_9TREE
MAAATMTLPDLLILPNNASRSLPVWPLDPPGSLLRWSFPNPIAWLWSAPLYLSIPLVWTLFVFALYLYIFHYPTWTLSRDVANLPGPDNRTSWWEGNWADMKNTSNEDGAGAALPISWVEKWHTGRFHSHLGSHMFYTTDLTALNHVLNNAHLFPKPDRYFNLLGILVGRNGLAVLSGDAHRRCRKVMNPTFNAPAVQQMVPIFYDKAVELRDKFVSFFDPANDGLLTSRKAADASEKIPGTRKVDVQTYMGEVGLDCIGAAGFNYNVGAVADRPSEFTDTWRAMLDTFGTVPKREIAQIFAGAPLLEKIPLDAQAKMTRYNAAVVEVGRRLVNDKVSALNAALHTGVDPKTELGRDVVSNLLLANAEPGVPAHLKMSTDDVVDQIRTLLFAGAETTSVTMSYILYRLARHPEMQARLREEIMSVDVEQPGLDTLNSLTFLEYFVREVLRLHAPVPIALRVAAHDTHIPLGKPIRGRDGRMMDSVMLKKGQAIFIPIANVNVDKSIWGPDASEFRPERHATEPKVKTPGVYGNLMTFLGGTRNCIGYRFSLAETKVVIFTLLRTFTFATLPSNPQQLRMSGLDLRSYSVGQGLEPAPEVPLLVRMVYEA